MAGCASIADITDSIKSVATVAEVNDSIRAGLSIGRAVDTISKDKGVVLSGGADLLAESASGVQCKTSVAAARLHLNTVDSHIANL